MTNKSTGCFPVRVRFRGVARNVSPVGVVALGLSLAWAMFAGCATGQYTYVTTIGTGERMEFPLVKGLPERTRKGTVQILHAGLLPSPDPSLKHSVFMFAFTEETGVVPQSVIVEDVSDQETRLLFEDEAPKLQNKQWRGVTRSYSGDDPALHWLGHLGDTIRVFRFTITKADGQKVILHQAWSVPGWMKAAMRKTFGLPAL